MDIAARRPRGFRHPALVRVDGLSVASRTSSFAYKGRELSAAEIAGELKVAHILEGSVRKSGNRVRITAQLIDTGSDRHLWSETFDRAADADSGGSPYSILAWALSRPAWRNSPAFKRILRKSGVLGYWQAHGFPPHCRAWGETDFECDGVAAAR